MLYINEKDIQKIGIDWDKCTETIQNTVIAHSNKNTVQPIKPYLRFGNVKNRIIAMPAYVGEKTNAAGIKWIASFPENIKKNIPRASSIIVLNNTETGQVASVIHTSILSIIRTASVSSLVIKKFLEARKLENISIGIIGLGPIGQYHLKMCLALYGEKISKIFVYDLDEKKTLDIFKGYGSKIEICSDWRKAYINSDIVITCTVSEKTYIDERPKSGSLLLNVSLRDYTTDIFDFVKNSIIVDDWEEICRENTDIEVFHKQKGLEESQVKTITNVVVDNCFEKYPKELPLMFNPMGMAVFDIAIAKYYFNLAQEKEVGLTLE